MEEEKLPINPTTGVEGEMNANTPSVSQVSAETNISENNNEVKDNMSNVMQSDVEPPANVVNNSQDNGEKLDGIPSGSQPEIVLPAYEMTPPARFVAQSRLGRIAQTYLTISITAIVLIVLALLSSILGPIAYIFFIAILLIIMGAIVLFTVGTVLLVPNNLVSKMWAFFKSVTGASDSMMKVVNFCFNSIRWIALVGMIASTIAIVFTSIHKGEFKALKIVILSILLVLFIVAFVFFVITGGAQL